MPVYDFACDTCQIGFENAIMSYDEMLVAICPQCDGLLTKLPGLFSFDVKDSRVKRRQVLEKRFKKREKRIERDLTRTEQENLEGFCRRTGARRYY